MKNKHRLVLGGIVVLMYSCSIEPLREILITDFSIASRNAAQHTDVFYENTDSVALKTMQALVRFQNISPPGNRFDFVIETLTPDSLIWRDTLSVPYRQADITEAASLTYTDVKTDYRSNIRLNQIGTYRMRFYSVKSDSFEKAIIGIGLEITTH